MSELVANDKRRLFIGIKIPAPVAEKISALKAKFRDHPDLHKWTISADLHITLKFLGFISEEKTAELISTAKAFQMAQKPFKVSAKGLCLFHEESQPKVIWAKICEGESELKKLHDLWNKELRKFNFPKEQNSFTPHVTVVRTKCKTAAEVRTLIQDMATSDLDFGSFECREVLLYQSETPRLSPESPKYQVLARWPLK